MLAPLIAFALAAAPSAQVMAFNVQYDSKSPDASLTLIEKRAPELACLEELTTAYAARFKQRLGGHFPHRAFSPRRDGTWGIGLATRLPLVSSEVFAQAPSQMPAVSGVVKLGDQQVVVICVHLFPPGARRRKGESLLAAMDENAKLRARQAGALVKRLAGEKRPVLLLGDFNESDSGDAVATLIKAGFTRAPTGATWPAGLPVAPAVVGIDHILARGARLSEASVEAGGSDHKAVSARLELP